MSKPTPAIGRILIGEDVRVIAFKMAQALERAGYSVETANDGEECLQKARENPPDLLVPAVVLPDAEQDDKDKDKEDKDKDERDDKEDEKQG